MLSGGRGEYPDFLVHSKSIILRTRYRSEVGQLFSRRYDPLGCVWGAGRSEKYVHPPGTPLEKNRRKRDFLGLWPNFVPTVRKSFLGRADRKKLLIYPFPPQNIHILSIAPLEQILWLYKNGSQTSILGKNPLYLLVLQSSRLWRKGPRKSSFWAPDFENT